MRGKSKKEQEAVGRAGNGAAAATEELSVISKDMSIRGQCETRGQLRIEGRVAGDITASGVELTPSGAVDGDVIAGDGAQSAKAFIIGGSGSVSGGVVADEAVIQGRVHGGVQARTRLALEESAEVEGDVLARRLALKEGGQVNGNIRMGDKVRIEGPGEAGPEKSS